MGKPITEQHAWRLFIVLVLFRAVRDAESKNPELAQEARRWLQDIGISLAEYGLGIPHERFENWLHNLEPIKLSNEMLDLVERLRSWWHRYGAERPLTEVIRFLFGPQANVNKGSEHERSTRAAIYWMGRAEHLSDEH